MPMNANVIGNTSINVVPAESMKSTILVWSGEDAGRVWSGEDVGNGVFY